MDRPVAPAVAGRAAAAGFAPGAPNVSFHRRDAKRRADQASFGAERTHAALAQPRMSAWRRRRQCRVRRRPLGEVPKTHIRHAIVGAERGRH
jgi:hypothetical protein